MKGNKAQQSQVRSKKRSVDLKQEKLRRREQAKAYDREARGKVFGRQ